MARAKATTTTAAKPAAKKAPSKASAKAAPSHPTWIEMIKVRSTLANSLPYRFGCLFTLQWSLIVVVVVLS